MTTHTHAINVSHDQPPLPNQPFSPWLRGQTTLFIIQIAAILNFILFLASLVYYVSHLDKPYKLLEPLTVKLIVDYAHIIFIAVFIAVLIQVLDDNERGSYRVKLVYERVFGKYDGNFKDDLKKSKDQLKQFKRRFLWFWIGMLFLYVCFACQHSYKLATSETEGDSGHNRKVSFSAVIKSPEGRGEHFSVEGSFSTADEAKAPKPESNPRESGQAESNSDKSKPLNSNKLNDPSLFNVGDFKDLVGLAVKLRDACDPLSQYLRGQFSPDTKRQLDEDEYGASIPLSKSLQSALINDLNQLLGDSSLFNEQRFAHVTLTEQTRRLIKQKPQGQGLARLNRLLLEEAYPHEVAKSQLNLAETSKKLAFPFIVFFFNNLTLLFVFWCFLILYIPWHEMKERYYKYRNGSLLIFVVLTLLFPALVLVKAGTYTAAQWDAYVAIFDALSGVLNAITLALLIARLDSKLIGLPSWLISILYSYAAVQPLFMVFELRSDVLERISTSVLIFVFVSKIYFFLIIFYALQTGKMLNYLLCFPILRDRAEPFKPQSTPPAHEGDATPPPSASGNTESPEGRVMLLLTACNKYLCKLFDEKRIARQYLSRLLGRVYLLKISKVVGTVMIGGFFVYLIIASLMLDMTGGLQNDIFTIIIDCVQLLFILLVIGTLFLVLGENQDGGRGALAMAGGIFKGTSKPGYPMEEGEKQLKKFKAYFLYFWCATFLLYVVFLLDHLHVRFYLDNTGSVWLTSKPTGSVLLASNLLEPTPPGGARLLPAPIMLMLEKLSYPFLKFSLATVNSLFIFWCFVILRSPALDERAEVRQKLLARQRVWINYSSFVVALLIASYPLLLFMMGVNKPLNSVEMENYATVFNGVTGTLSAIVLALLIARMDSKFFCLDSWLIGLLFAYASIQPLFVAFALNDIVPTMVQTSVLTAALGLKICFFLIIAHNLQSGRLSNYLICFPFLKDRVNSIFENQFEIRLVPAGADSFTFLILKKNELRYSTPKRFKSKEECDRFVHYLRERMKAKDSYLQPRAEAGTYWVELRSDAWELICESLPLRSEEEAHGLIRESVDKIPYCKYNRT